MRYKIIIEYKGLGFSGWQRQKDAVSIQQSIEDVLKILFKEKILLFVAGRTDAGVHAIAQVAHFDVTKTTTLSTFAIINALNYHLRPKSIAILNVEIVSINFDARLSAVKRHYRYKIINRRAPLTIDKGLSWQVCAKLDVTKIKEQAQFLLGKHDFNSFRSVHCQAKSSIRTMDEINIVKNDDEITFDFYAKSFLHNQIRIIVGTLVEIGHGKSVNISEILSKKNRRYAGATAPPHGLYLVGVKYSNIATKSSCN